MTDPALPFVHPAWDELVYSRLLLPAADRFSDGIAFREVDHGDGPADTLAAHVERSLRIASGMRRLLATRASDHFAVISQNSSRFVNLWHAGLLGGGVIGPINTRLADAEIEYIIGHSGARIIFADSVNIGRVLSMNRRNAFAPDIVIISIDGSRADGVTLTLDDLIAAGTTDLCAGVGEQSPALLMYTGGTTGRPKGVLLSQRAIILSIHRGALFQGYLRTPLKHLIFAPMFHIGSIAAMSLCLGGGACYIMTRFDLEKVIDAIERYEIEHFGMPPSAIGMMINHPLFQPDRLRSLKTLAYGSSPMPQGFIKQLQEVLPWTGLLQAYGMTEAGPLLTYLSPDDHNVAGLSRSAGRALAGVEITIQDENGETCPAGVVGEVCARSGSIMTEYWRNPEATAAALRGGWYHSQDAGYLNEEGYLFLVDRLKDMIVSGGENVYSAEVESAISTHPAVAQVAVIGIPSEKWGESVHAIVVLRENAQATSADDLIVHCAAHIAGYKVPKSVEFRADPLPLSGAMKVLKADLKKPYWHGRDAAIA